MTRICHLLDLHRCRKVLELASYTLIGEGLSSFLVCHIENVNCLECYPSQECLVTTAMVFQPLSAMSSSRFLHLLSNRTLRFSTRLGSGLLALSLSLGMALPALAADPFRSGNAREIGELTENAFLALFKEGDYVEAKRILDLAESQEADEPLVQAMLAAMSYLDGDTSDIFARAEATKSAAIALESTDPLRSHLYQAVGLFMEGAATLESQGVARGTPTALGLLQKVFNHMDAAEAIDPTDPELNILKGYMDLMLAVNLPFSNPEEAIARMSQHGSPAYLSQRGIAIGYRDLDRNEEGLAAVEKALQSAPNNPELHYLKGQLLLRLGQQSNSAEAFNEALQYRAQLPDSMVQKMVYEGCVAEGESGDNCRTRAGYDD